MVNKLLLAGFLFLMIGTLLLASSNNKENAAEGLVSPIPLAFGNDQGLMYAIYAFMLGILVLIILTRIGVL